MLVFSWHAHVSTHPPSLPPSLPPFLPSYVKRHPVPIIEADALAGKAYSSGPPSLPSSPFGRLAGAICFDMDFPQWVRKGGREGVSLLLQPSWTWGPLGQLHAYGSAVRAVENGFNLFRCSSGEGGEGGREGGRGRMSHFVFVLFGSNASSFCPPFLPSLPPSLLPSRQVVSRATGIRPTRRMPSLTPPFKHTWPSRR